ncbi:hypothetical protein KHS38_00075 [Mucilaginibacter sp. Bleaf8]|uniref:hypothetical protein n=1 Tax=Mucilaginibacter sp. Bleaf8 TaxID=2834430 RepID=UPI001BCB3750|nr:hypothetical protein [Mucilaginibacter sp. Bleaf8]MBS7562787.1 hypothetical protein [Mucilaginibacter sp. Bleaf8]
MKKFKTFAFLATLSSSLLFGSCTKDKSLPNAKTQDADAAASSKKGTLSASFGDIAEIDISRGDTCYYWTKSGTVSSGTSTNSTYYRSPVNYSLPSGKTPADVVAIAIANTNWCYFWYSDGTMSVGYSNNATAYISPKPYALPSGKTPADILAISIAKSNNNVYTWYKDGTASVGNSTSLGAIRAPYPYTVAAGKTISNVVGIGIAGSNDHTYVWYNDGSTKSVSSGYTDIFDAYFGAVPSSF